MKIYKIELENFEGPFDLLLYLIKKEEMDIYDIPIARITDQYLEYINTEKTLDLNNAGEFLIMAATLMYIKSKMLLPIEKVSINEELSTDPRDELVSRLLEYKKYKEIAVKLKNREKEQSNLFPCKIVQTQEESEKKEEISFEATLFDLLTAFNNIYKDGLKEKVYEINRIVYRIEEKIDFILEKIKEKKDINLNVLFENCIHKIEIVVTFLALLELIKRKEIVAWQLKLFGEIWISNPINH